MSSAIETAPLLADEKQWCRWGGIAALLVAAGYLAILPLFASAGPPPATGSDWFRYLPGKTTVWWAILWISVVTDIAWLPAALGLCFALWRSARNLILAATVLLFLFVALDLSVTWTHHASLLALFHRYSLATDEAHRADYRVAAEAAAAILSTPLFVVYAIVIPSCGVLLAGIAMLTTGFGRVTAYTGLLTGLLGILSLSGAFPLVIGNALGTTLWFFLAGRRLLQLSTG
jgi:hypothetical protein